jgi:hypothetical protein
MAVSVIKTFYDNVITKLKTIPELEYVIQFQEQQINQETTSLYSYPAALVEVSINNVKQLVKRSDYDCNLIIHLLVKEMNHDMFGGIELTNKIYDALQGQHFSQSCSPIYYTNYTIDKKPENFSETLLQFGTIITYQSNFNPNTGLTASIDNIRGTFSYTGFTQSRGIHITQSQI